jgi:hypothetical protein
MGNLRAIVERDLAETLEGDFGLPIRLVSPEGVTQIYSANDPEKLLMGQVLYDSAIIDAQTGMDMVVHEPVVSLRRTSLDSIPTCAPGKNWLIKIPATPSEDAEKVTYRIGRTPEGGATIGFIRLYCEAIEQDDTEPDPNPELVPGPNVLSVYPKDVWMLVASNLLSGQIWILNPIPDYLITYRPTGGAAPTGTEEGVEIVDVHVIGTSAPIDVYMMARNYVGRIRLDYYEL